MKAVQQLLFEVDWKALSGFESAQEDLDVLVVDLPVSFPVASSNQADVQQPGTGDVQLSFGQLVQVEGRSISPEIVSELIKFELQEPSLSRHLKT